MLIIFNMMKYWLFHKTVNVSKFFAFYIIWVPFYIFAISLNFGCHLNVVEIIWIVSVVSLLLVNFISLSWFWFWFWWF